MPAAITSSPSGSLRNDFAGFVGFKFTVGASDLYVTHLGRWKVSGNTGTHTVKVYDVAAAADIAGGSASLSMTSGSAASYVYVALASRIVLTAGQDYIIACEEAADQWYDKHNVTSTADLTVIDSSYFSGGWNSGGSGTAAFGPPNFQYSLTDPGSGGSLSIPVAMHHYRRMRS